VAARGGVAREAGAAGARAAAAPSEIAWVNPSSPLSSSAGARAAVARRGVLREAGVREAAASSENAWVHPPSPLSAAAVARAAAARGVVAMGVAAGARAAAAPAEIAGVNPPSPLSSSAGARGVVARGVGEAGARAAAATAAAAALACFVPTSAWPDGYLAYEMFGVTFSTFHPSRPCRGGTKINRSHTHTHRVARI